MCFFSRTVIMSAAHWHGCSMSSSPLMTGTEACFASSRMISLLKALYIMQSTYLLRTWATSDTDSLLPILTSSGPMYSPWPPNWVMPTSKDIRVLRLGFSNTIPRTLPFRGCCGFVAGPFLGSFFRRSFFIFTALASIFSKSSFMSRTDMISRFNALTDCVKPTRRLKPFHAARRADLERPILTRRIWIGRTRGMIRILRR